MKISDVKTAFGSAVKTKRKELGFSQEELAHRAGLHRTYVSDVERGVRNLSLESIEKLANALELSIAGLFLRVPGETGIPERIEILLIEDDKRDVEMTLRAFGKARIGNVVHVAHDGAAALDFLFARGAYESRLNQPLPGLILLDLNLPKIAGVEVLRRIKADARTRNIRVLVLSATANSRDLADCRELGADSSIGKPVDFQSLSQATPLLRLDWVLAKSSANEGPKKVREHADREPS